MIVIKGTVNRTRMAQFKNGPAHFIEILVEHPDRASEALEILLAKTMNPTDFAKGQQIEIAVSLYAKDSRIYISALRDQPAKPGRLPPQPPSA